MKLRRIFPLERNKCGGKKTHFPVQVFSVPFPVPPAEITVKQYGGGKKENRQDGGMPQKTWQKT